MKLYEFEGKGLFDRAGIQVPPGKVVKTPEEAAGLTQQFGAVMAKAQVLQGHRGKEHAIIACDDETQLAEAVRSLLGRKLSGETVEKVLVEQKLDVAQEVYAAVTYLRASPAVILSASGGIDVEKACHESQEGVLVEPVNILRGLEPEPGGRTGPPRRPRRRRGRRSAEALQDVHRFRRHLGRDQSAWCGPATGQWIAADAKVEIDDDAMFRQASLDLPERLSSGRTPTRLEQLALENDRTDTRGSAGRMFYELDGDIIVLASGGGTSVEALDDLCLLGRQARHLHRIQRQSHARKGQGPDEDRA